jgi:hypothetical protein
VGERLVVLLLHRDQVGRRLGHESVHRRGEAPVGAALDDADAVVLRREAPAHGQRTVPAAVVVDDQLPVGEGLALDRPDGPFDRGSAVVHGEDDADLRPAHRPTSSRYSDS